MMARWGAPLKPKAGCRNQPPKKSKGKRGEYKVTV